MGIEYVASGRLLIQTERNRVHETGSKRIHTLVAEFSSTIPLSNVPTAAATVRVRPNHGRMHQHLSAAKASAVRRAVARQG
jgi:hypothetical protein